MLILTLIAASCGGSGGSNQQQGSGNGKVAIFITDNISFYKQVVSKITGIRLVNSGTGGTCEILGNPITLDLSNLSNLAQYVNLAQCPAGQYNRIDISLQRNIHLMNQLDAQSSCAVTSYLDESGETKLLACDPNTGICMMSIRGGARDGAVTVQEDRYNDLGIDFDLKQFMVADFGNSAACSVTMKVAAVSAVDMNSSGRSHQVAGNIHDLASPSRTFTLLAGGVSLTVDYSAINPALQENIDALLLTAQTDGLPVIVQTGDINVETGTITANRIFVKAAGTVSDVKDQPQWSFGLTMVSANTIKASHKPPAAKEGEFVNGVWANVRFSGYDGIKAEFIAASVEVLPAGMVIDD